MPRFKEHYDFVIIGSGLGGLLCGYLLCEEGYSVCILEKNAQIGGNLQTFKRDRVKFDSGVHYIGGLEKNQPLNPYFKYFNLMENVDLLKLDEDGYDRISFAGDKNLYPHGQGYENYIKQLTAYFPEEEQGIRAYCDAIKNICENFELYNLHKDMENTDEISFFSIGAQSAIESFTDNKTLQNVLAGSNMLYGGVGETAPFYIHALITDSYIGSAYKMKNSDQISKQLRKDIKKMGGDVFINAEVVKINNTKKEVENIELASGEVIRGDKYISNLHPTLTFKLMNTDEIRKANVNRILGLKNTISAFILYIKLKPGTQKYNNYNHYHFFQEDVWNLHQYSEENPIKGIAVFNSRENKEDEHAITLTAMAYMHFEDVEKWQDTFNTTLSENDRGEEYLAFKDKWTEDLFAAVEQVYPDIRENTESYYTATPLTQRDYTGSIDGAIYGISHDYNAPLHSSIKAQTKLSNLFLTGQNIILHGVLGVTIGAIVTAQQILGKEYVVNKMKKFV